MPRCARTVFKPWIYFVFGNCIPQSWLGQREPWPLPENKPRWINCEEPGDKHPIHPGLLENSSGSKPLPNPLQQSRLSPAACIWARTLRWHGHKDVLWARTAVLGVGELGG